MFPGSRPTNAVADLGRGMRGAGIVALALLLVASGCAGTLPGEARDQPTSSVTPAPVPASAAESPSWVVDGAVNADRLIAAHEERLADRPYRVTVTWNRIQALPNGTRQTVIRNRLTVARPDEYALNVTASVRRGDRRSTARPADVIGVTLGSGADSYADGSTAFVRRNDSEPRYERRAPNLSRYESDVRGLLNWALDADGSEVRRVDREGETWYEVSRREKPEKWGVDEFEVRALVSPEGLVEQVTVEYLEDEEAVTVEIRYEAIGTARIAEPSWVDESRSETRTLANTSG